MEKETQEKAAKLTPGERPAHSRSRAWAERGPQWGAPPQEAPMSAPRRKPTFMTRMMSDGGSLGNGVSEQADRNSACTQPPPIWKRSHGPEDSELGCPDKERLSGGPVA